MTKILVADIGGTHTRFGSFEVRSKRALHLVAVSSVPTASIHSGLELINIFQDHGYLSEAQAMVLAVAGVVENERYCRLTNAHWDLDLNILGAKIPKKSVLINDFVAQALGCTTPKILSGMLTVQRGIPDAHGVLAAIGPGTGLGMCTLVPQTDTGTYFTLPSEGGHAPWPFLNSQECAFQQFLLQHTGYAHAFGDIILSGRGLSFLHEFLTGRKLAPPEAAAEAGPESETAAWFARFFGRACRILALHVLPRGGLFLCGGVVAKNPHFVTHSEFLRECIDNPAYRKLLSNIPIHLTTDPQTGLYGAAKYAQQTWEL
ncbi:MAG: glucokinase [Desulfovibrionales bacterium]|nr:glucokinase [Desulfovibrionales bacterium]